MVSFQSAPTELYRLGAIFVIHPLIKAGKQWVERMPDAKSRPD